ncbi:cation-translocating P-type ATPase [Sinomicrobium weinanense]|uniref:HAD-IC family P-type ATPase n=1 Tax=Sinomicrobium weinanense TaxID=2842200 RepID=A0A926JR73_9FLAO|nr:HAD-IC family P-type ATPase [Sinomicrobium weinanense]MBC9795792.1 HAD-IC family P-type ATPase [Sinomicrobium weinanense]MBU3121836.1 HAD-IC family P-type ATPase [Sinomicrobium weinanense]
MSADHTAKTPWHHVTAEQVFRELQTTALGLTDREAEDRRTRYGRNELRESGKRSWISIFGKQFGSLLVIVLFVAAIISQLSGNTIDTYIILSVIFLNACIGFTQEWRAEKAAASLKTSLALWAKVLRNGKKETLLSRELVPGDIIFLEEGDQVPADARLIETRNVRTIEAALTGESLSTGKDTLPLPAETILPERKNMVYKGTFLASGYAVGVITATGMNTAIGNIAGTLQSIRTSRTNFQKKTDILGKQMALLSVTSAVCLFVIMYFFRDTNLNDVFITAIAILVAAIPEGLPAVLSIVLAIGIRRMSKRKVIVREFTATETLGAVTTIITDKTGTLTQNSLTVQKIGIPGEEDIHVTGEGWFPAGNFVRNGHVLDVNRLPALQQFLQIAGWCNNAEVYHDTEKNTYKLMGDPTEGALLVLARKGGVFTGGTEKLDDTPFDSARKRRATLVEKNGKKQLFVIGAPEQILEKSTRALTNKGVIDMDTEHRQFISRKIEHWSDHAMRIVALAYRDEPGDLLKINKNTESLTFAGIAGMTDPPRPGAKSSVARCRQAGIRVIMATGDHINTALAIARTTGILETSPKGENTALTETQLSALDEREFEKAVLNINVFARLTPQMKLRIANTLQQKGELIAMTGDGVNDAPALKKADVGIAMGIMGTDVARDAAKIILADDNFSTIVNAIEEGRIVFNNARNTSFYLVTTNLAEIATLISALAIGMPLPLTATQILWLNLITDGTEDMALASEKGHGDLLREKPVNPKENILNKSILPFLFINAALMAVVTLLVFNHYLPEGLSKARTTAFAVMSFYQFYNVFNMRTLKLSVFSIGMFSNKYINAALVFSIIVLLCLIEVPFLRKLFGFQQLSFYEFIFFGLISSSVLWIGELYKYLRYNKKLRLWKFSRH